MRDIGSKIKAERLLKGISQKELADVLGVKQNTVSEYEHNVRQPNYDLLVQIADFFDVTTDYLLGRNDI